MVSLEIENNTSWSPDTAEGTKSRRQEETRCSAACGPYKACYKPSGIIKNGWGSKQSLNTCKPSEVSRVRSGIQ